jgi:nicotinate-nucleotide adenylyltransferase
MVARKLRIGIFGGTFDPIHAGHLSVAQQVARRLDLDHVVLVPSGRPPHKRSRQLAPAGDRLEMTRLAARGMARLKVSDVEVRRSGTCYTIDTLAELREAFGPGHDYWFIIGADTVGELPTWHRAAELLEETEFAIAARPGFAPDFDAVERALGAAAARRLRLGLVEVEPCDVSSTEIRRRAAAGEDLAGLVRADVARYIKSKGLYADSPAPPSDVH